MPLRNTTGEMKIFAVLVNWCGTNPAGNFSDPDTAFEVLENICMDGNYVYLKLISHATQ